MVYLRFRGQSKTGSQRCSSFIKIDQKNYKEDFKGNRQTQAREQAKSILDNGKEGGQNYNQPSQQWRPPF